MHYILYTRNTEIYETEEDGSNDKLIRKDKYITYMYISIVCVYNPFLVYTSVGVVRSIMRVSHDKPRAMHSTVIERLCHDRFRP